MSHHGSDDADVMTCDQLNREINNVVKRIQEKSLRIEESRHDVAIPVSDDLDAAQQTLLDRFVELLRARARKGCSGWA